MHGDSSPVNGKYRAWFWRFPNDVEGADKLLEVRLDKRPSFKKDVDALTPGELAERMHRTRYYEGFHDPRPGPGEQVPPGGLTRGQRANVADYAKALTRAFAAFNVALAAWSPVDSEPPAGPDLATALGHQAALRALGFDPGQLDGVMGPRTRAALAAFQEAHGLDAHGLLGRDTQAALRRLVMRRFKPLGSAMTRKARARGS